jgi:hypothetical protein
MPISPPAVLLLAASSALAQPLWVPPEVQVEKLGRSAFARVPLDEVAVGDAMSLNTLLQELRQRTAVRQEEVALIRVTVKGEWFLTPAETAKERASLLGANYIAHEYSFGGEGLLDSQRHYRAWRLERNDGVPLFTRPRAAVDSAWRPRPDPVPAPAPAHSVPEPVLLEPPASGQPPAARGPAATEPPPAPRTGEPLDWLWKDHGYILSHRLGLDLSQLGEREWRELERVVRAHFRPAQLGELRRLRRAGGRAVIDMRQRKLWAAS